MKKLQIQPHQKTLFERLFGNIKKLRAPKRIVYPVTHTGESRRPRRPLSRMVKVMKAGDKCFVLRDELTTWLDAGFTVIEPTKTRSRRISRGVKRSHHRCRN